MYNQCAFHLISNLDMYLHDNMITPPPPNTLFHIPLKKERKCVTYSCAMYLHDNPPPFHIPLQKERRCVTYTCAGQPPSLSPNCSKKKEKKITLFLHIPSIKSEQVLLPFS